MNHATPKSLVDPSVDYPKLLPRYNRSGFHSYSILWQVYQLQQTLPNEHENYRPRIAARSRRACRPAQKTWDWNLFHNPSCTHPFSALRINVGRKLLYGSPLYDWGGGRGAFAVASPQVHIDRRLTVNRQVESSLPSWRRFPTG